MTARPNIIRLFTYRCRDLGYGIEADTVLGYWTGAIDTWGKYTINRTDGRSPLYLFKDEITHIRPTRLYARVGR